MSIMVNIRYIAAHLKNIELTSSITQINSGNLFLSLSLSHTLTPHLTAVFLTA